MKNKNKIAKYRDPLIITAVILFTLFFWDSVIIYPFKLFSVFIHEVSHAIAGVFTGGAIRGISITDNLGGITGVHGGNNLVIAIAGYLGSIIFGALLFFSSYDKEKCKWTTTAYGIVFILLAANLLNNTFTIIFVLVIASLFIGLPRIIPHNIYSYIIRILGLLTTLYVPGDVIEDVSGGVYKKTDARFLESITGINSDIWSAAWVITATGILVLMVKYSYKKAD